MDRVGEFKLEANAEFRRHLFGSCYGAVFLDAGNVWLLRPDSSRPGAALSEAGSLGKFLDQVAVGTGAGLRYDLSFLVVRFDVGVGLHLPYKTTRSGWYNIPSFRDALGFHLATRLPLLSRYSKGDYPSSYPHLHEVLPQTHSGKGVRTYIGR